MRFVKKKKIKKLKEYRQTLLSSFTIADIANPITFQGVKTALIKIDRAMARINEEI